MELFLVRHGETQANAEGIIQGWLDTDLNENGLRQAEASASTFGETVEAIFSSDLNRAKRTAEEFRKKLPGIPYQEDSRLRERNFGDASGQHRDGYDWEVFWASSDSVSIPNAETLNEFDERIHSFVSSLRESRFTRVLIVTHGGTINRFQSLLDETHQFVRPGNASVTKIVLSK